MGDSWNSKLPRHPSTAAPLQGPQVVPPGLGSPIGCWRSPTQRGSLFQWCRERTAPLSLAWCHFSRAPVLVIGQSPKSSGACAWPPGQWALLRWSWGGGELSLATHSIITVQDGGARKQKPALGEVDMNPGYCLEGRGRRQVNECEVPGQHTHRVDTTDQVRLIRERPGSIRAHPPGKRPRKTPPSNPLSPFSLDPRSSVRLPLSCQHNTATDDGAWLCVCVCSVAASSNCNPSTISLSYLHYCHTYLVSSYLSIHIVYRTTPSLTRLERYTLHYTQSVPTQSLERVQSRASELYSIGQKETGYSRLRRPTEEEEPCSQKQTPDTPGQRRS